MSLQGRTLRMVRAGKPVSVGERVSESDAFTLYRAWAGDAPLAVSWYPDRPVPGDQALLWWPIYPRFVRTLFERAFTAGLSDPSSGRVTEEQWLSALARLEDCVWTCSCGASVLRDPDDPGQRCWNCELTVQ
jgi:hypothetical protein